VKHAHFGLEREHRGLHGDGVPMCAGISSGRINTGVWQLRTQSRVTVKTKSKLVWYILVRNLSTVSIVTSGRYLSNSGPQVFHIAFVEKVAHLRTRPSRHSRPEWPGSESAWESRIEKNRFDY